MATVFEVFVNTELPRRPVMFTYDITGHDADPNLYAAIGNAPRGSLFLERTAGFLWKKDSQDPATWTKVSGGGSGIQFVTTAQRIALPGTDKKVVFDTDLNTMFIFDGTTWAEV